MSTRSILKQDDTDQNGTNVSYYAPLHGLDLPRKCEQKKS